MKLKTIVGALLLAICMVGFTGCSSEEKATDGDAEVVKTTEKNENPAAKTAKEQAVQGSGGNGAMTLDPPPSDGN